MADLKFHPYATMFPALSDDEIDELADDIEQNGQQNPIWVDEDGLVLDGRNRSIACRLKGITPKTQVFCGTDEDKLHFVCSQNVKRRHLDSSQRSMIAAKLRDSFDALAKARQVSALKKGDTAPVPVNLPERGKGDARDQAGAALNVSGKSVDMASKVIKKASPEVVKAVETGKLAVSKAAKIADLPKDQQVAAMEAAPRSRSEKPKKSLELWFAIVHGGPIELIEIAMSKSDPHQELTGFAVWLSADEAMAEASKHYDPEDIEVMSASDYLRELAEGDHE